MLRCLFAALLLVACTAADAKAQTKTRTVRKKTTVSSSNNPRKNPKINPHTGKPYGAGVSQDVKDGSAYLAPGIPMRKRDNYKASGGYNDNRARTNTRKTTNSSLSSGGK